MILKPETREDWLKMRQEIGIGGSDAGAVLGLNPWKTNVDLWKEKTGIIIPDDISDKPAVKFGKEAENLIRGLFALDFPEYSVSYHEFWMYVSDSDKFMYATLDGELLERATGQRGVLEIKTTTIQNNRQWDEWDGKIPDHYYAQVLHQLACTGWDFVILKARIRYYGKDDELKSAVRHYRINRDDVSDDISFLCDKERDFIRYVREKKEPPLILPRI